MNRDPGSFRDPSGHVFVASRRVFRGISADAAGPLQDFIAADFFRERAGKLIVDTREVSPREVLSAGVPEDAVNTYALWVEHEPLPLVTYPYEWPFESLQAAAHLTLQLLLDGLQHGYVLKDASAFNVQFINSRPIFIDVLSFDKYKAGEPFLGYRQFCEQFLAPLCLAAFAGIDFNPWLRGRLDGLSLGEVAAALPLYTWPRPVVLLHIHLHAWAIRRVKSTSTTARRKQRLIPRRNLLAMVEGLDRFVAKLRRKSDSYWRNYAQCNSYDDTAEADKLDIVKTFVGRHTIHRLLDLGCNTGDYSQAAIHAGARQVVGIDSDCGAVDFAARQARQGDWPAQFLYCDVANPSPAQGWMLQERSSLEERLGKVDGVLCLALIHHVVIGKNIPLDEFVQWVLGLGTRGLIEFVPKSDPMTASLLHGRKDVFQDYQQENLERLLKELCRRVWSHPIRSTCRLVYEYEL